MPRSENCGAFFVFDAYTSRGDYEYLLVHQIAELETRFEPLVWWHRKSLAHEGIADVCPLC